MAFWRLPEKSTMSNSSRIHSSAVIGDGVTIGSDVTIGPHAVLLGPLEIGDRVWIGPGAILGTPPEMSSLPQNAAWADDLQHHGVIIESDVVIRELSTVTQGSHRPTRVRRGSWLLNTSYVAHDVELGESVTLSSGARIGGHATIGDFVNIGLNASVHQRRTIGAGAMVGMGSAVSRDVLPFSKVFGSPVRRHGINAYALRKLGASDEVIAALEKAYAGDAVDLAQFESASGIGPLVSHWLTFGVDSSETVKAA